MSRSETRLTSGLRVGLPLCMLTLLASIASSQAPPVLKPQIKSPSGPNLTGVWTGNDGGTYHLRQVGSAVWWVGASPDGGQRFANVFRGTRVGNTIDGEWVDVPPGRMQQAGQLVLTVVSAQGEPILQRERESGGFGGSTWRRSRASGEAPAPPGAAPQTLEPRRVVKRTILPNGTVEIRYADGTIEQRSSGGMTIIFPDGRPPARLAFTDAPGPEPPLMPTDPDLLRQWREYHNKQLLAIISTIVVSDPAALQALRDQESQKSVYQQINLRAQIISRLSPRE
jgi:hypothetical protein